MGEFHYIDLFATKGIEYIVVIVYLLLLVPFWKFLTKDNDTAGKLKSIIVIFAIMGLFGIAIAQDREPPETIVLNKLKKTMPETLYGEVEFPHSDHFDYADDCSTCHHHSKGETLSCSRCHEPFSTYKYKGSKRITGLGLKGAYHARCLNCHKEQGGPTGCTDCHERTNNPVPNFANIQHHPE